MENQAVLQDRLLVVDDEKANVDLLCRFLTREGYDVSGVFNGEQALARISLWLPDLILLDVKMPVMDGLSVCEKLRSDVATRSIPIILLSAHNALEDRLRGLRIGVDDYIGKPFDLEEIKERLKNTLQRRRWDLSTHPLTHLPGSPVIEDEVRRRLRQKKTFAFAYLDLDSFKAYNDVYGYEAGDKVIKCLATFLITAAKEVPDAFAGHVGGDDFIFISTLDHMREAMATLVRQFDIERDFFYNAQDLARGSIQTKNRQGKECTFRCFR